MNDEGSIALPPGLEHWRRFPMDGALLLFDRRTGWSALCDGEETKHLRMRAPRVVQFAITNACNLACTFCSRDETARSSWTEDEAFDFLAALDRAGTLEVAFGGGEPLVFKGFLPLVERLAKETQLAVSLTTNGTRLDDEVARRLAPHVGQVRLSVYDDVPWRRALSTLVKRGVRCGVNYLVTPGRLATVEARVLEVVAQGCGDVLLLSYNGRDGALHLSVREVEELKGKVLGLQKALHGRALLKLDICWGERMESVPTLLGTGPCSAGREFVVVTSDRRVAPCSFHHLSFPVSSASDLLEVWRRESSALASPAMDPGCAREPGYGLRAVHRSPVRRLPTA